MIDRPERIGGACAGFTLIEVLVSLFLAAILISSTARLLRSTTAFSRRQSARNRELQTATGVFDLIATDFRMALASGDPSQAFKGGHFGGGAGGSVSFLTAADSRFALLGGQAHAMRVVYRTRSPRRTRPGASGFTLWRNELPPAALRSRNQPTTVCDALRLFEVAYLQGTDAGRPRFRESWPFPDRLPAALRIRIAFAGSQRTLERVIRHP